MKNLYSLNLNEVIDREGEPKVMRVPGGWIYFTSQGAVFVPYHEEFKEVDQTPVDVNEWPAGIERP